MTAKKMKKGEPAVAHSRLKKAELESKRATEAVNAAAKKAGKSRVQLQGQIVGGFLKDVSKPLAHREFRQALDAEKKADAKLKRARAEMKRSKSRSRRPKHK